MCSDFVYPLFDLIEAAAAGVRDALTLRLPDIERFRSFGWFYYRFASVAAGAFRLIEEPAFFWEANPPLTPLLAFFSSKSDCLEVLLC